MQDVVVIHTKNIAARPVQKCSLFLTIFQKLWTNSLITFFKL